MSDSQTTLSGRVALVTGGASGIGKCACIAIAKEGAQVIVADANLNAATATARSLPGVAHHVAIQVDVGCSKSVALLFKSAKKHCPTPISIVVNSAGILTPSQSVLELSEEEFDEILRVNLKGTFLTTQAAARSMIADEIQDGAIVNMASLLAKCGRRGFSAYTASKAGVIGLTKAAALDLASKGIRVNAVMPSLTETPLIASIRQDERVAMEALSPLGRMCRPEEVAEVIKFLCGPGSSFITGTALQISGGIAL